MYPAMCLAGKLVGPAQLNAVAAGRLAHMLDQTSGRHFLVDTGSSFSILPFSSSSRATGPSLTGPADEAIPCWGEVPLSVNFGGKLFQWTFLRVAVQFPILGVDFLHGHPLLVDVAANCVVQKATNRRFFMQASPSGPTTAAVTAAVAAPVCSSSTFVPCERPSGGNVSQATSTHQTRTAVFPQSSTSVAAAVPAAVARWAAPPEFQQLLSEFMDVLNPSKRLPVPTHGVEHFVVTTGPPVASPFH